jgi:hypothetical protein
MCSIPGGDLEADPSGAVALEEQPAVGQDPVDEVGQGGVDHGDLDGSSEGAPEIILDVERELRQASRMARSRALDTTPLFKGLAPVRCGPVWGSVGGGR